MVISRENKGLKVKPNETFFLDGIINFADASPEFLLELELKSLN